MTTPSDDVDRLRADWLGLVASAGAGGGAAEEAFADLAARYSEPGRFYHTLPHVADVLATIDTLRDQARDLAALRFAAWFHDAVYDPRASDNEERSADLAAEVLGRLGVADAAVQTVRDLVLLTKAHRADPDDRDGQVLLDADLAILGAEPERYAAYGHAIRREYAWVPEGQYRAGRRRVLEGFLSRERIYYLEAVHAALEARARRNLAEEIASLS